MNKKNIPLVIRLLSSSVRQMQKFGLDPQDIKYVEDRIETLKKELEKSE